MGLKWDLFSLELLHLSKEKSNLGPKLSICEYKNVFECFCTLLGAKTKPFKLLEIGLMSLEIINFGLRNSS